MMTQRVDSIDFSRLDIPEISNGLFHPRPALGPPPGSPSEILSISTDDGHFVDAVYHPGTGTNVPTIIFFHGNGEIVDDYAPLAPLITALPASLVAVEYRGYGRSTGQPTVSSMMADARLAVAQIDAWLTQRGATGPRVMMGRSLGSAPALAVAANFPSVDGVIIESGFAHGRALLNRLGMGSERLSGVSDPLFGNALAIASVTRPTLIIHGTLDQIIPVDEAQSLYAASGAEFRELVLVDGADHNSLWAVGAEQYLSAVAAFLQMLN